MCGGDRGCCEQIRLADAEKIFGNWSRFLQIHSTNAMDISLSHIGGGTFLNLWAFFDASSDFCGHFAKT